MYDGVTFQIGSRNPGHALLGWFVIPMLVVDMAYLFTKCEDCGFWLYAFQTHESPVYTIQPVVKPVVNPV